MRLTSVEVTDVKGVSASFAVDKRNLLIRGPMGSGKTAIMESILLGLGLPTPHGSKNLERLSPTGKWAIALEVESDSNERFRLERTIGKRSGFVVNGRSVSQGEWSAAIASLIDCEPHHVNFDDFVGLSGQKRAAVFGAMLSAAAEKKNLEDTLGISVEEEFSRVLGDEVGDATPVIRRLMSISGTPAEIADAVREQLNSATQEDRDAKARLDGIRESRTTTSTSRTPAEVRQALREVDERIGSLRDQQKEYDRLRTQYERAEAVIKSAQQAAEKAKAAFDAAAAVAATMDEADAARNEAVARLELETKTLTDAKNAVRQSRERRDAAFGAACEIKAAREAINKIANRLETLDENYLKSMFCKMVGEACGTLVAAQQPGAVAAIVAFINEMNSAAFAKEMDIDVAVSKADKEYEDARKACDDADATVIAHEKLVEEAKAAVRSAQERLKKAQDANESLELLGDALGRADQERAQAESAHRAAAPAVDTEVLQGQLDEAANRRAELEQEIRALEEANSISGQLEAAKLRVSVTGGIVDAIKAILDRASTHRERQTVGTIDQVLTPFQERVDSVFGGDAIVKHAISGKGRSQQFDFALAKYGATVPLETLSGGETILVAAAFLSALQSIKQTPGSILAFNSEPLDERGCEMMLGGFPRLGVDLCVVTSNRIAAGAAPDDWQVVDMG